MRTNTLATVPSSELTSRLYELRGAERRLLVELLVYLGEVDRRRLHAELGFSSFFVFLSQHLGYSSSAAYRRSTAARLVARFPVVAEYLGDGRLSLTTLVELRDVLDEACLEEVLARAAGRSEDEVKRLVAALRPRPAVPDSLRRKPVRAAAAESAPTASASTGTASTATTSTAPADSAPTGTTGTAPGTQTCAPSVRPPPKARVVPLSATQHLLRATVSEDFVRDLEAVRAALSHKLPSGSLEAVLHECLRVTLAACHKRRRGAGRSRSVPTNDHLDRTPGPAPTNDQLDRTPGPAPTNDHLDRTPGPAPTNDQLDRAAGPAPTSDHVDRAAVPAPTSDHVDRAAVPAPTSDHLDAPPVEATSRYIPAAVRDEVWRRDGGRCVFVGAGGHVCGSRFQIEVHHLQPFARGGAATASGLALMCRTHNLFEAERDFGREHVRRAIEQARHKRGQPDPRQARLL